MEDATKKSAELVTIERTEWEALQRKLGLMELILESMPAYIWHKDMDGVYRFVNRTLCDTLRLSPRERIGKTDFEIFSAEEAAQYVAADREVIATGRTITGIDRPYLAADGTVGWTRTRKILVRDGSGTPVGTIGLGLDITEQKRLEEELQLFKTISDQGIHGQAIADLEGTLVYVNAAFARSHEFEPDELIGKHMSVLHTPQQLPAALATIQKMQKEGRFQPTEVWHVRRDGTEFPMMMSGVLIRDSSGVPRYVAATAIDITDLHRAEKERAAAAAVVAESLRYKETLLRESHHRIKNHFATLESFLNLQAHRTTHDETIERLNEVKAQVSSMRILYQKLLADGDFEQISARAYLEELGSIVVDAFGGTSRIALRTVVADLPIAASAVFPLGTVVTELITNSLKYAYGPKDHGSVDLTFAPDPETADRAILEISDTGVGLPADFDADTVQSFGLLIVRMLTDQLGGTFFIGPNPAGGTRCRVSVPLAVHAPRAHAEL